MEVQSLSLPTALPVDQLTALRLGKPERGAYGVNSDTVTDLLSGGGDQRVRLSSPNSRAMNITAQKLLEKVTQLLSEKYGQTKTPEGVNDAKKDPFTPEATSDRIVKGIGGIFSAYAKKNSDMSPEELISSFMEKAYQGVDQGYKEAGQTLTDNGLFSVSGVKDRADQTISLVKDKLAELEKALRQQYGLESTVEGDTAKLVAGEISSQAGETAKNTANSASSLGGKLNLAA